MYNDDQTLDVFLPCRSGSERIKNKNTKSFCDKEFGLLEIKIEQLLGCQKIRQIVVSTDDELIIKYLDGLNRDEIVVHRRDQNLALSSTSTDELVQHAYEIVLSDHILWTHVTSPFVNQIIYDEILETYFDKLSQGYDSLMTVTEIQAFLWQDSKPLNYDREVEKWPRTQTLEAVYEINSAAFIAPRVVYQKLNDRIGRQPFLFKLDHLSAHDVDWPEDYELAQALYLHSIRGL